MRNDDRVHGVERRTPRELATLLAAGLFAVLALAGCATVRSAQDAIGGWFGRSSDEAKSQSVPIVEKSPETSVKKPAKKPPAVSAPREPADADAATSAPDAAPAEDEPPAPLEEPERSVFDPY